MRAIVRTVGRHLTVWATALGVVHWVFHGLWGALVLNKGTIVGQVLNPGPYDTVTRLAVLLVLMLLGLVAGALLREARDVQSALREDQRRIELITEAGSMCLWEINPDGEYAYLSPMVASILGYQPKELLGRPFHELYHPDDREQLMASALTVMGSRQPLRDFTNRNVAKDARTVWLSTSAVPLVNPRGEFGGYRGVHRDITDRVAAEERYRYQSFHDGLTGLLNRACFEEEMLRFNRNLEHWKPFNVVVVDVDGLKIVNDTFGHNVGDELLRAVARVISAPLRTTDIVARIGGDEFCIILPTVDQSVVQTKKDEILRLVEKHNSQRPAVPMSLSLGIASLSDQEGETAHDVYRRADDDMYHSRMKQKQSRKNKLIELILAASSGRDFVSEGRVERIETTARLVAKKLNLPDDARANLLLLARVHDLGMIGVPDRVLFKPRKLAEDEFEAMKTHTRVGYNIASRSKELSHIAELILHHHERWDGAGYPAEISGEQIPLECRILAVLDAYDAMITSRPYASRVDKDEAITELKRCAGTQFDPRVVEAFVAAIA